MSAMVVVYCTRFCPYCVMAARLIESKGVDYVTVSVDREPGRRLEMERLSGRHTVPQIFIADTHIGGYAELAHLERTGRLDAMLEDDGETKAG
jgi:glutaredoxin 3